MRGKECIPESKLKNARSAEAELPLRPAKGGAHSLRDALAFVLCQDLSPDAF